MLSLKFKDQICRYSPERGLVRIKHVNKHFYCLNCNKRGHLQKNCRYPINSYGVVLYKQSPLDGQIRYLTIQRKYSPFYTEIMRARYVIEGKRIDTEYLGQLIQNLPQTERYLLMHHSFEYLWKQLWKPSAPIDPKCRDWFGQLQPKLVELFRQYPAQYLETDWEFPKGRRNKTESDQECALRECYEETGLNREDFILYPHIRPFQEKIHGINGINYCNSYYLARVSQPDLLVYYHPEHLEQNREIRNIAWLTLEQIIQRCAHLPHRISMIKQIDSLVQNLVRRTIPDNF